MNAVDLDPVNCDRRPVRRFEFCVGHDIDVSRLDQIALTIIGISNLVPVRAGCATVIGPIKLEIIVAILNKITVRLKFIGRLQRKSARCRIINQHIRCVGVKTVVRHGSRSGASGGLPDSQMLSRGYGVGLNTKILSQTS